MMLEVSIPHLQAMLIPSRIARRAEKLCALIIIYTMHFPTFIGEIANYFGTDQTG
jgi:hypothetical protein